MSGEIDREDNDGKRRRSGALKRWRRAALFFGPVVALLAGGYFYATGGRFVGTDNAYVKADKVVLSPRVSGMITEVLARENQRVMAGDPLIQLDESSFRITLAKAEADLQRAASDIEAIKAQAHRKQVELRLARVDAEYARRESGRQAELVRRKAASQSQLDAATHAYDAATINISVIEEEYNEIVASLGGDPEIAVADHPRYIAAKAVRDEAALDLAHTTLRAPFGGLVSNMPEPGRFLDAGQAALGLVADNGAWLEANFKETDLTHVAPGQSVTITVDTYPGRTWSGTVESIGAATSAEFSVLPAQNATGNWVKVVQRIPVRISIEDEPGAPKLRAGMSTEVEVDTGYHNKLARFVAKTLSWENARAEPTQ